MERGTSALAIRPSAKIKQKKPIFDFFSMIHKRIAFIFLDFSLYSNRIIGITVYNDRKIAEL